MCAKPRTVCSPNPTEPALGRRPTRRRPALFAFGAVTLLAICLPGPATAAPATRPATATHPASRPADDFAGIRIEDEGASQDAELFNLEIPTVVTAARREQKITHVPYAISVITRQDIRSAGARTVADALRLAPGVDVAEMSSGNFGVSCRGFAGFSARTLVLVDGRAVSDALLGGMFWGVWPIQIEDLERIEVIRGPGVTWGANAANGVINIITRDPADQQGLTLYGRGGSRGSYESYAGYGFKVDKLRLRVSGGYENSDGANRGGSWLKALDDDYASPAMTVTGVYEAGPQDKLFFSGGSRVAEGGMPRSPIDEAPPINQLTTGSYLSARWEHTLAKDNVFALNTYVNDFGVEYGRAVGYRYQQLALQLNHTFKPADNHTVTWGVDARNDLFDGTNYREMFSKDNGYISDPMVGVYVQDEWHFAPRWALNLGGRIDYESYGGFNPSARAALSYELTDNSSIYAAISQAYRLYPAASRFIQLPQLGGLVNLTADRGSKATPQLAYELGYRGRFFDRLDVTATAFWHEASDELILGPELGPPGLIRQNFHNGPSNSLCGVELEGKYKVNDQLTLLGNYTYQYFNWRGPEFTAATDSVTPPTHKFALGARYSPIERLHLSSQLYYVDSGRTPNPSNPFVPLHVDSLLRLDLRAQYDFCKDKAFFAVGVRNLLDPHHLEGTTNFLSNAEVPRMVYAEIGIRLDP